LKALPLYLLQENIRQKFQSVSHTRTSAQRRANSGAGSWYEDKPANAKTLTGKDILMPREIDHGSDIYAQEVERVKNEREQAAQQMAEQLVDFYKKSASWRTSVKLKCCFAHVILKDLAKKYNSDGEVLRCAISILAERNWFCKANNTDPFSDYVELSPLPTGTAKK
jgi:hypothetical protein